MVCYLLFHQAMHRCFYFKLKWSNLLKPWTTELARSDFCCMGGKYQNGFSSTRHQAPVPLTIFRSNSKFDEKLECSSLKYAKLIITKFCTRHDSVVCNISLWLVGYILNYSTANFGRISNSIEISLVGRPPGHYLNQYWFIVSCSPLPHGKKFQ